MRQLRGLLLVGLSWGWLWMLPGAGAAEPAIPYDSETDMSSVRLEAEAAALAMRLPDGFRATVFAAEPDVQNPIAVAWDGRGRLWIAENYTYAERSKRFDLALRDRILIFSDADGDGRADKRQVFTDELQMLTSVEVGTDGIWALCPPRLLFIPDRDHDDRPDGPAVTVLDGFDVSTENYHGLANGLRWGPDGWLYGRCGASCPGLVGTPGASDGDRTPLRGGMWRYHPGRRRFEALCHGTTNPWGHDWNAVGEAFFINTVNGHLWHMIPGAHFPRSHTLDPNHHAYDTIEMHADHWHWDHSQNWTDSRGGGGKHDDLGGGHAHTGATIYLGDNWPESYRDRLMTLNLHGRRINVDRLDRVGSGYLGRHEPDIARSDDPWFRGLELTYGPDGGVFILDWSDTGECHEQTGVHRTSGRIYKVTCGAVRAPPHDNLEAADLAQLVECHRHDNEWFARLARRELVRRRAEGQDIAAAIAGLRRLSDQSRNDPVVRLRVLWTLWGVDATNSDELVALLDDENEHVRTWAIRLLTDHLRIDGVLGPAPGPADAIDGALLERLSELAASEKSGLVRLVLASTLQRSPVADRPRLAAPLLRHAEDAHDPNLPFLIWFGLIPVADESPEALVALGSQCELPAVRVSIARRLAESMDRSPQPLEHLLAASVRHGPAAQQDVVAGLSKGLAGWQRATPPSTWPAFQAATAGISDENFRTRMQELNALFGDGRALDDLRLLALDDSAELLRRMSALTTLIQQKDPQLRSICEKLLSVRHLNAVAARGLATFDDPAIGVALANSYRKFPPEDRPVILESLVSRAAFVPALVDQMQAGAIPRHDLSAAQARQIRSLGNPHLSARLSEVWGDVRDSSEESQREIARWKECLTPTALAAGDAGRGRMTFNKVCAGCHRLYGEGATIGPDLTGAGRQNLDYLLNNIFAPSDVVAADYRLAILLLADGRVLNGIRMAETERTVTLQTATARLTIERSDIEETRTSALSLMPDGLLKTLDEAEVINLFSYLSHPTQFPLPPAGETAVETARDHAD